MNKLFKAGKVKPTIDGPYKLDEMHKAFRTFLNWRSQRESNNNVKETRNGCLPDQAISEFH